MNMQKYDLIPHSGLTKTKAYFKAHTASKVKLHVMFYCL